MSFKTFKVKFSIPETYVELLARELGHPVTQKDFETFARNAVEASLTDFLKPGERVGEPLDPSEDG